MPLWKAEGGVNRCTKDIHGIISTAYSNLVLVTKVSPNAMHVIFKVRENLDAEGIHCS